MIRPMSEGDIPAVLRLCQELGYDVARPDLEARLRTVLGRDDHLLLVADHGVVIGWVHASESYLLTDPPGAELAGLVVSENARRLGTGRSLVVSVEAWARSRGLLEVRLRTNVKRRKAHKFYKALGYTNVKKSQVFVKPLH